MNALLMTGVPVVVPTALTQDGHLGLDEVIVFGVVTLVIVAYGIGILIARRAVNAIINIIGVMVPLVVLYIANELPLVGIIQVVVYTGVVMVLVLFVIMLVGVGSDEPMGAAGIVMRRPVLIFLGPGLAGVLTAVVWRSTLPKLAGLKDGAKAVPDLLAVMLYYDHVVTMELTTILFIVATVGALTFTRRQRIRARFSQRAVAAGKMQDYAAKGAHPGRKPMPDVYASTSSVAIPTLDTQSEAVKESVPQVLRTRDQGLELSDVSPETGPAQCSGTTVSCLVRAGRTDRIGDPRDARRPGMPSMPGAAAPTAKQSVLSDDGAADSAAPEQKEEK